MEEEKKPENEVKNNDIEKIDVPLDEITSEDITEASFDSELLLKAIHDHNTEELKRIFDTIPDADIAKACEELDIKDVITLFGRFGGYGRRYACKPSEKGPCCCRS